MPVFVIYSHSLCFLLLSRYPAHHSTNPFYLFTPSFLICYFYLFNPCYPQFLTAQNWNVLPPQPLARELPNRNDSLPACLASAKKEDATTTATDLFSVAPYLHLNLLTNEGFERLSAQEYQQIPYSCKPFFRFHKTPCVRLKLCSCFFPPHTISKDLNEICIF